MEKDKENSVSLLRKVVKQKQLLLDIPTEEDLRSYLTRQFIKDINDSKYKPLNLKVYGITGPSGAGKDTFVEELKQYMLDEYGTNLYHLRFGDFMKDLAFKLGMVPYSRKHYEKHRGDRFDELPNGKTPLSAWIALDVIREYNPYAFIEPTLKCFVNDVDLDMNEVLVFSGMRTEAGLRTVSEVADKMIHISRPTYKSHKDAVLDELQIMWPTDEIITNDGSLDNFKELALQFARENL